MQVFEVFFGDISYFYSVFNQSGGQKSEKGVGSFCPNFYAFCRFL